MAGPSCAPTEARRGTDPRRLRAGGRRNRLPRRFRRAPPLRSGSARGLDRLPSRISALRERRREDLRCSAESLLENSLGVCCFRITLARIFLRVHLECAPTDGAGFVLTRHLHRAFLRVRRGMARGGHPTIKTALRAPPVVTIGLYSIVIVRNQNHGFMRGSWRSPK